MNKFITTVFRGVKDASLAEVARVFLNYLQLEPYGTVEHLRIDTGNKEIQFELMLKGEENSIPGSLRYVLQESPGDLVLVAENVKLSREWMNVLVENRFTPELRRFSVPAKLHTIVRSLV